MLLDWKGVGVVSVIGVAVLWYVSRKAGDAVETAVDNTLEAVNPTNPENIFASGTNAVGGELTGQKDFSLGSWVYDQLNTGQGE
jgi:hypothetical protein